MLIITALYTALLNVDFMSYERPISKSPIDLNFLKCDTGWSEVLRGDIPRLSRQLLFARPSMMQQIILIFLSLRPPQFGPHFARS